MSQPCPVLTGTSVFLAAHVIENLASIHAWYNDNEIQRLSGGIGSPISLDASSKRLERWMNPPDDQRHFAIHRCVDSRLVGFVHLAEIDPVDRVCKIGIVIGERACWGQGCGSEAIRLACEYAFRELALFRVSAEAFADNPRSYRMLNRAGLVQEGMQRAAVVRDEGRVDVYMFGLLRTDWGEPGA